MAVRYVRQAHQTKRYASEFAIMNDLFRNIMSEAKMSVHMVDVLAKAIHKAQFKPFSKEGFYKDIDDLRDEFLARNHILDVGSQYAQPDHEWMVYDKNLKPWYVSRFTERDGSTAWSIRDSDPRQGRVFNEKSPNKPKALRDVIEYVTGKKQPEDISRKNRAKKHPYVEFAKSIQRERAKRGFDIPTYSIKNRMSDLMQRNGDSMSRLMSECIIGAINTMQSEEKWDDQKFRDEIDKSIEMACPLSAIRIDLTTYKVLDKELYEHIVRWNVREQRWEIGGRGGCIGVGAVYYPNSHNKPDILKAVIDKHVR